MTQPSAPVTSELEGDFAVFLIGARINSWWRVHHWLPVARAMSRMIRELESHPELGLLGYESWGGRISIMVQYWRSMDQLLDYARARDSKHLPAWRDFNRKAGRSAAVGIWHETYSVSPGHYENIYQHMPPFGLGKVGRLHPARGARSGARDRLRAAAATKSAA